MKIAVFIGAAFGLCLVLAVVLHTDLPAMLHTLQSAGWRILWLIPYRALYFFLYALGWYYLLGPYDAERRAGLAYLLWVTSVREAVDRLLPVASVGGGVVGVRLVQWRGLPAAAIGATVIVEIVLTLIASYAFTAIGLILFLESSDPGPQYWRFVLEFLATVPVPVLAVLLLRYGSVFARLEKMLAPLVGARATAGAKNLDLELRACLGRWRRLFGAGMLQLGALTVGSFEVWFALRLFGCPVSPGTAVILESLTQAMRHLAFAVPAGLGVQEATLVLVGHALGISAELALAVSMAKRLREVLCAIPSLVSWQWLEGRRL